MANVSPAMRQMLFMFRDRNQRVAVGLMRAQVSSLGHIWDLTRRSLTSYRFGPLVIARRNAADAGNVASQRRGGRIAIVTREIAQSLPSSFVKSHSQTQVVRPR